MSSDNTRISSSSRDPDKKGETTHLQDDVLPTDVTADTKKPDEETDSLWKLVLLTIALASAIFCMSLVRIPAWFQYCVCVNRDNI